MADMTLEEALEAATVDEELVTPVNEVLLINPETRTINVPDSEKLFGARQDMNAERKYFKCPRIVGDNIDLSEHRIFINYVPSKQDGTYDPKEDVQGYWCKDLAVEGDFVTFSWKLSENVTRNAGYIAFAVYAKTIDEYGNLQTKWHTTIAIGNVLDTLPDGEEWTTVYPDIVMQLLERMDKVEKNGGNGTSDAVQYIEQTLTEEQQIQARTNIGAASANEVSKLSEDKASNPSTGKVGQILEIETVDKDGKPLTYKAVNKPTGGEVSDEQIAEAVENYLNENPIEGGGGADGIGIQSVEQTTTSTEDGGTNIITVTKTDGTSSTFKVLNGSKGSQGEKGEQGENGADGISVTVKSVSESTADGGSNVVTFSDGKTVTIKNGSKGSTGEKGDKGDKGDTGETGATGANGQDGKDYSFDATAYGLPVLYLTGNTIGITKENPVALAWAYGENSGSCTLKWQGGSSLEYDKKNYTIELDSAIDIGYGEQTKYCLKANFIDYSHARNIVSARLWGMMVASRKNINSALALSPNYGAVNGFPIVIILNGVFHGLYTFNIPKDGWMMAMGNGTKECILCADHSTATQFKGEALCDDSDFEIEYITDKDDISWVVASVNKLINACVNSNGANLDTTIAQYLDWESAIDYYILVALLDGQDMTDKNYILATYDGTKWFFSAYDMDSTYGLKWDASYFSRASYGDITSFVNYANSHRVMELIKRFKTDALKARYAELRADILSEDNIAREFERFACSIPLPVLNEDAKTWTSLPLTTVNNTFQILCWLNRRLSFVDKWIEELPEQETPISPSYTNLVPMSIDSDGTIFNSTGYKDGYRLSSSSGSATSAQEGSTVTGFIPYKHGDVIRIKGVLFGSNASADTSDGYVNVGHYCYLTMYDSSKTYLNGFISYTDWKKEHSNGNTASWIYEAISYDEETGVTTIRPDKHSKSNEASYIRINAHGNGEDMIVTVNEEIV